MSAEELVTNEVVGESEASQEQAEQPVVSEEAPAAIEKQLKRLKLKVDGQEIEEEIDLSDDEGLARKLQLAKAAQKRMQEASAQRKEAEAVLNLIKTNPIEAMRKLGLDPRQVAESFMVQELEREMLTPEEVERRAMQAELERYREMEAQKKQEEESRRQEQLQAKYEQEFQASIIKALDNSGLPRTPRTVARMAEYWAVALESGYEPDPSDLVQMVRESYIQEQKELLGGFDGDSLLKFLGEDIAGKIRKSDLKRVQQQAKVVAKEPSASAKPKQQEKLSWDEMQERIRMKIKG